MAENPETIPNKEPKNNQQKPIQTVVNSIMKSQAKQKLGQKQGKNYEVLFNNIKQVLSDLDLSIGDCKKYNEAKIHRKYEIRITDLENQVTILKNKLRQQQNARSPSKKYVQDLVDQLVVYKFQNERLRAQNQQLTNIKRVIEEKAFENDHGSQVDLTLQIKQKVENLKPPLMKVPTPEPKTPIQQKFNLKDQVIIYLNKQENIRKITEQPKSKFEIFLKKKLPALNDWSFLEFLSEINKWYVQYYTANEQKLSAKLRSNVLSTLQDEIVQQKLPKLSNPVNIFSSFSQFSGGSGSELKKLTKKRENRHNFSTMQVISGARQKYVLK